MTRLIPFLFPAFFGTEVQTTSDLHGILYEISFEHLDAELRPEAVAKTVFIINERLTLLNYKSKNIDTAPEAGLILIDMPTEQAVNPYAIYQYDDILAYKEGLEICNLWMPEDPEVASLFECLDNDDNFQQYCDPSWRFGRAPFCYKIGFNSYSDIESSLNACLDDPSIPGEIKIAWLKGESDLVSEDIMREMFFLRVNDSSVPIADQLVEEAWPEMDYNTGGWGVLVQFTEKGNAYFKELTFNAAVDQRPIAMLINGEVNSTPFVMDGIDGGEALITGNFMKTEAEQLAALFTAPENPYSYELKMIKSY